jgi:DNA-binding beta-propeller fold protein YncE
MKMSLFIQSLLVLLVGFVFTTIRAQAQTTVPPKKFVFVESVGSDPPPAAQSSIFVAPAAVAIGPSASTGSFGANFYVADPINNQVVVFPPGSSATPTFLKSLTCPSTVGGCLGPLSSPWTLNQPTSLAVDPNTGNLWISDTGNDVVVEVDPNTSTVVAFAGVGPQVDTIVCTMHQDLVQPHPISNNTVVVNLFDPSCTEPRFNEGQGSGQFLTPGPVAVDVSGNVYVVDGVGQDFQGPPLCLPQGPNCAFPVPPPANFRIEKFSRTGTFLTSFGSPGSGNGQFGEVSGIAVDNAANIYIADTCNNRVEKFDTNGTFLLQWGSPIPSTGCLMPVPPSSLNFGDGTLNIPGGIAVDTVDQSVYVVDQGGARIQQFDGQGNFLSKGGSNGEFEAQFNMPYAIATVPPSLFLIACELAGDSDCVHGLVISELSVPSIALAIVSQSLGGGCFPTTDPTCIGGANLRVQFLAARPDQDNDGITDEIDLQPTVSSNDFSNASLGFTTYGSIVDRGQQTFAIYNLLSPTPADIARLGSSACNSAGCDEIRIRTETFGGPTPLRITWCGNAPLSFAAGRGVNIHCSTPTVFVEEGPVGFSFAGSDGTIATATLNTGDNLSVNVSTSQIIDNAGNIAITVGGKTTSLTPGQSILVLTPDFSFSPASSITTTLGGSVSIPVTVNSISGFNSAVALSVSAPPAGASASFTTNPVTPPSGGSVSSALNVSLGPSVTPSTFTLTLTGTAASMTHSTKASVTVTADTSSIATVVGNLVSIGCINTAGIGNALTSKLSAAQAYISAGDIQDAINTFTALKNQINAQAGKHIATSCTSAIGGVAFNPVTVLLTDTQSLINSLRVSALADPITGYVVDMNGSGVFGVTVSILDVGGNTVATATTDITGFYYFAMTNLLNPQSSYTVAVTGLPAGFVSSAPRMSSAFTWTGSGMMIGNFVLN